MHFLGLWFRKVLEDKTWCSKYLWKLFFRKVRWLISFIRSCSKVSDNGSLNPENENLFLEQSIACNCKELTSDDGARIVGHADISRE